jgi:hypothetical protein
MSIFRLGDTVEYRNKKCIISSVRISMSHRLDAIYGLIEISSGRNIREIEDLEV